MSSGRANVLIVEDDVGLAHALAAMLDAEGAYEPRLVHCARPMRPPRPVDIELPVMSGYWKSRSYLRRHAQLQTTRLIALTDSIAAAMFATAPTRVSL